MWFVLGTLATAGGAPVLIAPTGMRTRVANPPTFDLTAAPGRCLLRVAVDEAGLPTEVEARSCPPTYAAAATQAVRGWRWDPITSEGQPAQARILVAIEFTGRGRIAVPPAARCTYLLRVGPSGTITTTGDPAPQCVIWAPTGVSLRVPAVGSCTVGVDPSALHDSPRWVDVSACAPGVDAVVKEIVGGSLYAPGTESTRFVLEFPSAVAAPTDTVTTFEIPSPGSDQGPTRLGNGPGGPEAPDPTLNVPTGTVPKVDLSALRDRGKAPPKPAPAPPPAPAPAPDPPEKVVQEEESPPK